MIRFLIFVAMVAITGSVYAQDLSNQGLMDIKDHSETLRTSWMKAFDDAVQSKNFSSLTALRQENETYIDNNLGAMRRLTAEGDGRGLLTAVGNYLQIERQFVKDVMIPAESLTASNQEGIDKTYRKINDFGDKERAFLIDINNALATERTDAGPASPAAQEPEMDADEAYEEPKGSVVEGRHRKGKGKLPHEQAKDERRKKGKKQTDEESDDE